jgi:hypothetical protein
MRVLSKVGLHRQLKNVKFVQDLHRIFRVVLAKNQGHVLQVIWSKKKSNEIQIDSTPL